MEPPLTVSLHLDADRTGAPEKVAPPHRQSTFTILPMRTPGRDWTSTCPRFNAIRSDILGTKNTWVELDPPDWRKEGEGDGAQYFEAVEEFFGHLYGALTGS